MEEDEIRENMEHEYMEMLLVQEEDRLAAHNRKQLEQEAFDEEAMRLTLEAEARFAEQDLKREQDDKREHEEWEKNMGLHPSCYLSEDESYDQEPYNRGVLSVNEQVATQESFAGNMNTRDPPPCDPSQPESDKGKGVATSSKPVKKGTKRPAHDDPLRIYHKNRGRSERIFGQKMKKTGFGPKGEGSTPNSAFSVD